MTCTLTKMFWSINKVFAKMIHMQLFFCFFFFFRVKKSQHIAWSRTFSKDDKLQLTSWENLLLANKHRSGTTSNGLTFDLIDAHIQTCRGGTLEVWNVELISFLFPFCVFFKMSQTENTIRDTLGKHGRYSYFLERLARRVYLIKRAEFCIVDAFLLCSRILLVK